MMLKIVVLIHMTVQYPLRQFWEQFRKEIAKPNDQLEVQVNRVHYSSFLPNQFGKYYQNPGIPVIICGLLEDLNWDLTYLCQELGDRVFPIRQYGQARYQQDKRQWQDWGSSVETHSMKFSDYVDKLKTGEARANDLYLARCSLKGTAISENRILRQAEAWFDLKFPVTYLNLWLGSGGHVSCLHYDTMDGILMQIYGEKEILLFSPSQTYNLYPVPIYKQFIYGLEMRPVYSQVYPKQPDFQAFPKLRKALLSCQKIVLKPGEILFLPAGWWHEITSLGEGTVCSINRFWNVLPVQRALCSWNKWRVHLGSLLAIPHIAKHFLSAMGRENPGEEIRRSIQKL
ncbi:cupin-like domain-containing protein [bacterium]|nr:cupin-like domain-containing protein [bacterium]